MDKVGASMAVNNVTDACHFLRGLSISEIIATNLIWTWEGGGITASVEKDLLRVNG